ncbi:hypothetical protein SK128_010738, partial [Halocaridina rubra]
PPSNGSCTYRFPRPYPRSQTWNVTCSHGTSGTWATWAPRSSSTRRSSTCLLMMAQ